MENGASRFHTWMDAQTAEWRASDIGKCFAVNSPDWSPYHTGGGCLAITMGGPGWLTMVTDGDGCGFPELDQPMSVGHYDSDDDGDTCLAFGTFSALAEIHAASDLFRAWRAAQSPLKLKEWAEVQTDLPALQRGILSRLEFDMDY